MKNLLSLTIAILTMMILSVSSSFAQDNNQDDHSLAVTIPEVALLDLESSTGTAIVLAVEAPTEAGLPVNTDNAKDSSIWLNYSSVVGSTTEASRIVTVQLGSGAIPGGLRLRVKASNDAGQGDGTLGVKEGWIVINNTAKTLISDIGTCYTGNGPNKGHNLYYDLKVRTGANQYRKIDFDEATTVTVVYTISNN